LLIVLVLVLVIVLESLPWKIDHEQEHENEPV
jgi:hypothetical protein